MTPQRRTMVCTIGFTRTTAEHFFERLLNAGVQKVMDVRLHNTSQLAGFAKAGDLEYFLRKIGNVRYTHEPLLAPTDEIMKTYKQQKGDWSAYRARFFALMRARRVEDQIRPEMLEGACLLCSEATPEHCHRRLVCEYLNEKWHGILSVTHL
ncbi:MAG TPA: DUF488 domain-containing protein [bacterium]|nr:DUF488 domain-containing protein [bacterium]